MEKGSKKCGCGSKETAAHKVKETVSSTAEHLKNVVQEKATEAADIAKETIQHARHSIEERKK